MRYGKNLVHAGTARRSARLTLFASLWCGSIRGTLELCKKQGMEICFDTAAAYLRDPRFIDIMREQHKVAPGSGILTREELQRRLTRIFEGIEPDGWETVCVAIPIVPGDDDYDFEQTGAQFRKEFHRVEKPCQMKDRLKAGDLLGRTLAAFVDKIEVTGDLKVSVTDLLDADLRPVIDVLPEPSVPLLTNDAGILHDAVPISHNNSCTQESALIESIL